LQKVGRVTRLPGKATWSQHAVIFDKIELYRTGLLMKLSPADRTVAEWLKAARQARCSGTNSAPERGESAPAIRD